MISVLKEKKHTQILLLHRVSIVYLILRSLFLQLFHRPIVIVHCLQAFADPPLSPVVSLSSGWAPEVAMGSRIKSFFFGKSSPSPSPSEPQQRQRLQQRRPGNPKLKGQSYDAAVAAEAPVQGSYPVAGNGPNVVEEIQRSRARRDKGMDARRQSVHPSIAAPLDIARYREGPAERPRTAPYTGEPGAGYTATTNNGGRTLSGFTMKSPPTFFNSGRAARPWKT